MKILRYSAVFVLFAMLCFSLRADKTFYLPFLKAQAQASLKPERFWFQGAFQGDDESTALLLEFANEQQDTYWLSLLFTLGSLDALYSLAMLEPDIQRQKQMLNQSAAAGHAPSQYELSLITHSSSSKLLWLQKAAEAEHLLAQIALYQWYMLHHEVEKALPWLEKTARYDANSALLFAKLLWKQGEHAQAIQYFEQADQFGESQASLYLQHVRDFWRKNLSGSTLDQYSLERPTCTMRLQFVANSLESIRQATRFQRLFVEDKRLSELPVCINPPIWVEQLRCSENWEGQNRLGCELNVLEQVSKPLELTHLVVFAEHGKANVNNGIMFLDLADSYSVFVHELAHFAGFVDEYPLSKRMSEIHCRPNAAPNLVVVPEWTEYELQGYLTFESEGAGLFKARTCNNHSSQAYKLTSQMTFMEYHDQGVIPDVYLQRWKEQLLDRQSLTPVFVNFAQYFQKEGKKSEADYWWNRLASFENSL